MQEDTEAGVRRAADVQKRRADRLAQAQQVRKVEPRCACLSELRRT
jgi:hypothetical protein